MNGVKKKLFKELKKSVKEGGVILRLMKSKKFQERKKAILEHFENMPLPEVDRWLLKPNKGFDGKRPIDISDRRFNLLIEELKWGPFA